MQVVINVTIIVIDWFIYTIGTKWFEIRVWQIFNFCNLITSDVPPLWQTPRIIPFYYLIYYHYNPEKSQNCSILCYFLLWHKLFFLSLSGFWFLSLCFRLLIVCRACCKLNIYLTVLLVRFILFNSKDSLMTNGQISKETEKYSLLPKIVVKSKQPKVSYS